VYVMKPQYPPRADGKPHTWQTRLMHLLNVHGWQKVGGGARASNRTFEVRREVLFLIFKALRRGRFKIEDPANIDRRHIQFICADWAQRRDLHARGENGGLADASVANLASVLRTFCGWIGQPQLMAGVEAPRRSKVAQRDLTWEGAGLDTLDVIERAWHIEPWVAVALLLQFAFGLRQREAVMFRTDVACRPGERALSIGVSRPAARGIRGKVSAGSKGGRSRIIMIHAAWENSVLEFARVFVRQEVGIEGHVGQRGNGLLQNLRTYRQVLEKLGITRQDAGVSGHGLRAAFAVRALNRRGLEAPVRGGDLKGVDKKERDLILRTVAEDLGHSRASIGSAYYGSLKARGDVKKFEGSPDEELTPRVEALLQRLAADLRERHSIKLIVRRYRKAVAGA
jgi:integrase